MTRYAAMFDRCAAAGESALGAFVMLGDPDRDASAAYLDALVEGGSTWSNWAFRSATRWPMAR